MEVNVTFADFIAHVKIKVAHCITSYLTRALGETKTIKSLAEEAAKHKTQPEDPRFLVNFLFKRWKQDFECLVPNNTSKLPGYLDKIRALFNIDAHSGQASWFEIRYFVDNLLAGLDMFQTFPEPYHVDTSAALVAIKELWNRVDKTGGELNSGVKWDADLGDVFLPSVDNDELSVIMAHVPDMTADLVEKSLDLTLGITPTSCKKLPDGSFEVIFANRKDMNACLSQGLRVKNKLVTICKKQAPKEVKYIIQNPPIDIPIEVFKNGIELSLGLPVVNVSKNTSGELEIVFAVEVTSEKQETTIRNHKIQIERKVFSASNSQTKILVYGTPSDWDAHKIEETMDCLLAVKCNAVKLDDHPEIAVLLLCKNDDLNTILHQHKNLWVYKSTWYFEPYCEHVIQIYNTPIGAKPEHITSALNSCVAGCQLVYYSEKAKAGFIHCPSEEGKAHLLRQKKFPLLAATPACNSVPGDMQKPKVAQVAPLPVSVLGGATPSFMDKNKFVSVTSGNGLTEITFLQKGDLGRLQSKGFSCISTICDAKSIKYTIIDGSRLRVETAIPADVKAIMDAIQGYLQGRESDCVTVGEVERFNVLLFKTMAKHFTNITDCIVTVRSKPGRVNNQMEFVEIFVFGFKANNDALKQTLSAMKHPVSQEYSISEEDAKIIADIAESLEQIKTQYFIDVVLKDNKVTIRALSALHRDQGWQAVLAEVQKRKESTELVSMPCVVDYFDTYMRSDFQEAMFQKQLKGVTIQSSGNKFVFNGIHAVGEKVRSELKVLLEKLAVKTWHEKLDYDLARQIFSAKKIQQILRENEVSYFFPGKTRNLHARAKKSDRTEKKTPTAEKKYQDRGNNSPVKVHKEKRTNARTGVSKSNTNARKNKKQDTPKNRTDMPHLTKYFRKKVQLRELSFVCQDATKLAKCLEQLKNVLLIQSAQLNVTYTLTKFIVQNIKDIESKYKVIIRDNQYSQSTVGSDSSDSGEDSESDGDSDNSNVSDTRSTVSSDFSDKPKNGNQCYITGMARNTIKAMNYIKDYENNLSWEQTFKLPPPHFILIEKYKKSDVKMMCKKYNVEVSWPVHTVKPASSPSKAMTRPRPILKNAIKISGKKVSVEEFIKALSALVQTIQEKSVQVPAEIPFPLLLTEKRDIEEKFGVVVKINKASTTTATSDDISDNDSEEEIDTPAQQTTHKILIAGTNMTAVSDACDAISGPYITEVQTYTLQQFDSLFKDFVIQGQIKNFQTENTVFMRLEKPKIKLQGRKANVDAAQNLIQIRLNGKFSAESILVPKKVDFFMRKNKPNLFDARQQGAKVLVKPNGSQMELTISGDRNNVVALKTKLEDLQQIIMKNLHTVTNGGYEWKVALVDLSRILQQKHNVWTDLVEAKPTKYDCGSILLINNVVIHLKKGDIFTESGSAIISCDNEEMKAMGGIAKPIATKAGPVMHTEVATYLSQFGKLTVGTAMTTRAGDLSQFQYVIHVVGPVWSGGNAYESTLLTNAVRSVIDQATRHNMTKIVLPSISTGVFNYPKKLAAEIIATELLQSVAHTTTLREIVLIDLDDEMLDELCVQFEALYKAKDVKNYVFAKNQWYWQENNGVFMPYDPDQNFQIELAYQTGQQLVRVVGDLNQVKNGANYDVDFTRGRQRNVLTQWERLIKLEQLPEKAWVKLEAPAQQAKSGLIKQINFAAKPTKLDVVQITGLRHDVDQAVATINDYIGKLTQTVQMDWHGGSLDVKQSQYLQQYGVKHTIEKRKLTLSGLPDALDKARLLLMEQAIHIVKYPDHWDDQQHDCQLFVVDKQSLEWTSVTTKLKETMPNAVVVKIERIQNKTIWEDYCGHVQKLRKAGNATQVQLFHGTRNTSPQLIYTDTLGFRNQFSSPQCYWGHGNYFAVNSSYSNNYAHHLPDGSRQMFLAEVLVGDPYLAGANRDSSLRVPPEKQKTGTTSVRFDSVQGFTDGSTVYIVYENGRAYPAYLITYNVNTN